ncbi:unnamed protein product [Paramecium pentaurelia]|uniref:Transmembrane protein n=1 Tax=Paramecium pentaurelia TaxID=43138 RepID=A0A8S1VTH0_9CILI|nr:unnamed protein product [Paramecium pentaurelia]
MQVLRFKQEFYATQFKSVLTKNEQIFIQNESESGIFDRNPEYSKKMDFFKVIISYDAGKELYQSIYQNIVALKNLVMSTKICYQGYIKMIYVFIFLNNYHFVLLKWHIHLFSQLSCARENPHNNREHLQQGFNEIYQDYMESQLETNIYEIKNFLNTPEYYQVLLPYLFQLNKIIFISADILERDYLNYLIYTIIYGLIVSFILFYVIILCTRRLQRQIRANRQVQYCYHMKVYWMFRFIMQSKILIKECEILLTFDLYTIIICKIETISLLHHDYN